MRTEVCAKANVQLNSCMYGSEELVANNVHGARRLWEGEPPSYFNHMLGRRATPIHTDVLFVQSRVSCTILGKRMCVFKLYLDSLLSESDWGGFVGPFWDSYDPERLRASVCDSGEKSD